MATDKQWAAHDLEKLIRARYPLEKGYVTESEVCTAAWKDRIDMLAVGVFNSTQGSQAFEVKVTRGDMMNELDQPAKNKFWRENANRFWYVCAPGIVTPDEIPEGCGLLVAQRYQGGWHLVRKKMAKNHKGRDLPQSIWRRMLLRGDQVLEGYRQKIEKYVEINGQSIGFDALDRYIRERATRVVNEERERRKGIERYRRRNDGIARIKQWGKVIELLGGFFDVNNPPTAYEVKELLRGPMKMAQEAESRETADLLRALADGLDSGDIKIGAAS